MMRGWGGPSLAPACLPGPPCSGLPTPVASPCAPARWLMWMVCGWCVDGVLWLVSECREPATLALVTTTWRRAKNARQLPAASIAENCIRITQTAGIIGWRGPCLASALLDPGELGASLPLIPPRTHAPGFLSFACISGSAQRGSCLSSPLTCPHRLQLVRPDFLPARLQLEREDEAELGLLGQDTRKS